MNQKLYELIRRYERKGDFTHTPFTEEMLKEAQNTLQLILPPKYVDFLQKFGHGGIGGIAVLGVGKNGQLVFVNDTLTCREYSLPQNLIVIENCDEWLYCINADTGVIVMWSYDCDTVDAAYQDFDEYLGDRLKDEIENM